MHKRMITPGAVTGLVVQGTAGANMSIEKYIRKLQR